MKLKLAFLLFIFGIFSLTNVSAQKQAAKDTSENMSRVILFEGGLDLSSPLRTYAQRVDDTGFGFVGKVLVQTRPDGASFMGLAMYYHSYESASVDYLDFFNNVSINVRDKVSTHDIGLDYVFRHFPGYVIGRFEPYIEASLGMKWMYSTFSTRDLDTQESYDFDFLQNDLVFTYGAILGTQVYVKNNWFINISIGYYGSASATYHGREDGLSGIDAIDFFRLNTTLTDLLRTNIGATWAF